MSDMTRLAHLAANPQGTTREEIYLAVASLYRIQGPYLSPRERALMGDILRLLARDVELTIRTSLAERLAEDASAPHELILLLCDDTIEVARPVILRNPLLTDADALRLIAEADVDHHEAIAARANIGEPVTEVLARSNAESVLVTLVRNVTARFSSLTYETLVEKSRWIPAMQDPLVRRTDLPLPMARKMAGWVSDALRTYIERNHQVPQKTLDQAFAHASHALISEPPAPRNEPAEGAQKLIEKLAVSGQLKAGFLLRVLHQGQIDLFDLGLAKMLEVPLEALRKRFYDGGTAGVALACRAVGIDRCVFPTVFRLSRYSRGMPLAMTRDENARATAIFDSYSKAEAAAAFKTA